jgi:hypothetical protein
MNMIIPVKWARAMGFMPVVSNRGRILERMLKAYYLRCREDIDFAQESADVTLPGLP